MFPRSIALLLLVAGPVRAAEPLLLISQARYFLIEVDGPVPTISELTNVINLGTTTPPPPPPPPPGATTKDKLAQYTRATNDPLIAHGIAQGAYGTVRAKLERGSISWPLAQTLLKAATDLAVGQSQNKPAWTQWRADVGALIDNLQREGKLTTKEQQVAFLRDVEEGMTAAFPAGAINLEQLLALIRMIIDLIATLLGQHNAGGAAKMLLPLE